MPAFLPIHLAFLERKATALDPDNLVPKASNSE